MYGVTNNRRPADVILSAKTLHICAVYTTDGRTVATGRAAGTAAGALAYTHVQQLAPINQPPVDASPRRRRPAARPIGRRLFVTPYTVAKGAGVRGTYPPIGASEGGRFTRPATLCRLCLHRFLRRTVGCGIHRKSQWIGDVHADS